MLYHLLLASWIQLAPAKHFNFWHSFQSFWNLNVVHLFSCEISLGGSLWQLTRFEGDGSWWQSPCTLSMNLVAALGFSSYELRLLRRINVHHGCRYLLRLSLSQHVSFSHLNNRLQCLHLFELNHFTFSNRNVNFDIFFGLPLVVREFTFSYFHSSSKTEKHVDLQRKSSAKWSRNEFDYLAALRMKENLSEKWYVRSLSDQLVHWPQLDDHLV